VVAAVFKDVWICGSRRVEIRTHAVPFACSDNDKALGELPGAKRFPFSARQRHYIFLRLLPIRPPRTAFLRVDIAVHEEPVMSVSYSFRCECHRYADRAAAGGI
jgi:hypothetical protein